MDALLPNERDPNLEPFRNRWDNPWVDLVSRWFFHGLDANILVSKNEIDRKVALRHLQAIMVSFAPSHGHKESGVAFLMSRWFDIAPDGASK